MGGPRTQRPHCELALSRFRRTPGQLSYSRGGARGSNGLSIFFSLRWARILSTTTGSVMTETTFISSPQRGQTSGSTS